MRMNPIVRPVPAAILVLTAGATAVAQSNYHVAPCGSDDWSGTSDVCAAPHGPKRTIQAAINAAANYDTVIVAPGTYAGPGNRDIDFGGKSIVLRAQYSALPPVCTIDCGGKIGDPHRAFHFHSGEGHLSRVQGFTIRNGFTDMGGAVLCEMSSPLFQTCFFEDNTAFPGTTGGEGGAVRCVGGAPRFDTCLFQNNQAVRAGGVGGRGGAVQFVGGSPVLLTSFFIGNTAGGGGALHSTGGASPWLMNCSFAENWTADPAFNGGGAYLASLGGHSTFTRCRFVENRTARIGGAAWFTQGAQATIEHCLFLDNYGFDGGAVGVANGSQATITNCLFAGNASDIFGSALEVWNGPPTGAPASATITQCTFAENTATAGHGAIVVSHTSTIAGVNNVVWGNTPSEVVLNDSASASLTFSAVRGGWPGNGNINTDPRFETSGPHPFALADHSPCIDRGSNAGVPAAIVSDLAGMPRLLDDPCAPSTGMTVDMGAYEFRRYPDCNLDGSLNAADVTCFLQALSQWSPYADCNGDGAWNGADFGCFRSALARGCH